MTIDHFNAYHEIIPDFSDFQESLKEPFPVHLRVNGLKIEPALLLDMLREKGVHLKKTLAWNDSLFLASGLNTPGNLPEYVLGYFHPQALTSCLVPLALPVKRGDFVLDMCASPGGKTTHLAQLMNNTGLIIANELYPSRHIPLGHTLNRLGILNTVLTAYPAQEFPLKANFDRILADVPCSGEGRFRVTGEGSRYRENPKRERLPQLQKKIITRGFDLLKNEGELIYATCTYAPEENESVVNHLLKNRDATLLPIHLDLHFEPGLTAWKKETYDRQLQQTARLYPHRINSVGFFMARIGKGI